MEGNLLENGKITKNVSSNESVAAIFTLLDENYGSIYYTIDQTEPDRSSAINSYSSN